MTTPEPRGHPGEAAFDVGGGPVQQADDEGDEHDEHRPLGVVPHGHGRVPQAEYLARALGEGAGEGHADRGEGEDDDHGDGDADTGRVFQTGRPSPMS